MMTTFKTADSEDSICLLFGIVQVRESVADRKTSSEYWNLVLDMKATNRELYFRYVRFHLFFPENFTF